jgi:photosystem II stability/assembly factor-like uncharacterized protein
MKSLKALSLVVLVALYVWSWGGDCEVAALTASTGSEAWQSYGIGGGGALYSATMSPYDTQVIYIATDMTSVFRTDNFGKSWETINFTEIQGGIGSHVRFTSSSSILYSIDLGSDKRVPKKSTDGGKTWSALAKDPTSEEAYFLHANPSSTEGLLVSSYVSLYFSKDGGTSFSTVYTTSDSDGLHIAGAFWDGNNIFVGTHEGLLVSTDGGTSFTLSSVSGIPANESMATFAGARENSVVRFFTVTIDSTAAYAGITGEEMWDYKGVYRLDWGQGNWAKTTTGIDKEDYPFFIAMALDDVDIAYVAGGDTEEATPIIYKSTDGGSSWTEVFLTENNENITTGWCGDDGDQDWWFPEYALGFAVSPNDPTRAIITDLGFAHVTDDGGASWHQAYVNSTYENTAGSKTPTGQAYSGNGIEDTSSWWVHWTGQSTIIVAFTDICGIRSNDKGQTWTSGFSLGLPYDNTYHLVEHPSTGMIYGATSNVHDLYESMYLEDSMIDNGKGTVVMSNDKGKSWQTLKNFGHPVVWLSIDSNNSDTMYASVVHSSQGGIYVTTNLSAGSSATWTKLNSPSRTEGHPFNSYVLDDGTILATYSGRINSSEAFTESSGVFISTDGGTTWEDRSDSRMTRWTKDIIIDPYDSNQNTWYVTVFSHWGSAPNEVGGLYRTTDRGKNWTRISDLYRVESAAIHPDKKDTLYLSTETRGLWSTEDLTAENPTFTQVADYPFSHPIRIFFNPSDHDEVWVTSFGGGLRVYDSSASLTTTTTSGSTTTSTSAGLCPAEEIYGEYTEETELLKYIRDNIFSKNQEGQELIRLYYGWSPAIVRAMEEDQEFKEQVKEMIDGVLELIMEVE